MKRVRFGAPRDDVWLPPAVLSTRRRRRKGRPYLALGILVVATVLIVFFAARTPGDGEPSLEEGLAESRLTQPVPDRDAVVGAGALAGAGGQRR